MLSGAIIGSVAAFVMLSGAEPFGPEDCAREYIHYHTLAPTNFGNGVILIHNEHVGYHNPSYYWAATRLTFVDCGSGRAIELLQAARNDSDLLVINKENAVQRLFSEGAGMAPDTLMPFVTDFAERHSIPMENGTIEGETCGCRAFYPELRGDKEPYEAKQ